jgi:hypothetical protein
LVVSGTAGCFVTLTPTGNPAPQGDRFDALTMQYRGQ